MSKLIAVVGATGAQGSSIANFMLASREWKVRAITRDKSKDVAKQLESAGAELICANTDDEESLIKAFDGVQAVFAVTNFWEHLFQGKSPRQSGEIELKQGMNIARAASKTPTLEHYLWSTLGSATKLSNGRFPVPHTDYKAEVDDRIKTELPMLHRKTTFLHFGFYTSNLAHFPLMKPMPTVPAMDGPWIWILPCKESTKMAITGDMTRNPGIITRQVLANPEKTQGGKRVSIVVATVSVGDLLKQWSEVTGKRAVYLEVTRAKYAEMWGPGGVELGDQLANNEEYPDWEAADKADYVKLADIGIEEGELLGHMASLVALKEIL